MSLNGHHDLQQRWNSWLLGSVYLASKQRKQRCASLHRTLVKSLWLSVVFVFKSHWCLKLLINGVDLDLFGGFGFEIKDVLHRCYVGSFLTMAMVSRNKRCVFFLSNQFSLKGSILMVACSCKFSIEVDKTSKNPLSCSHHNKNVSNWKPCYRWPSSCISFCKLHPRCGGKRFESHLIDARKWSLNSYRIFCVQLTQRLANQLN